MEKKVDNLENVKVEALPSENSPFVTQEHMEQKLGEAYDRFVGDIKIETENLKKDFLTFFGLFASFMTFLSIEIQLFKNRDDWMELLGVTSVSFSFIVFFALVLNDIAKQKDKTFGSKKEKWHFWRYVCIVLVFAGVGVFLLLQGGRTSSNKAIEKVEKQLAKSAERVKQDSMVIDALKKSCENLGKQIEIIQNRDKQIRNDLNQMDQFLGRKFGLSPFIRE
jgi:hypothetical protein